MIDSIDRSMFYGAKPHIFQKAKALRENMTEAEKMLWSRLCAKQLGYRFKAQHPIDIFIADFYCHELKLVVEVDGEYMMIVNRRFTTRVGCVSWKRLVSK